MLVQANVPIPMRDGVRLYADVYRPVAPGRYPVLLMRTPYGKSLVASIAGALDPVRATRAGYVIVAQDTRGRFTSEGDFTPWIYEGRDGYDTIEWCAAQSWSTGAVGTYGGSYVGFVQWLAARERPPHLKAMVPLLTFADLRTDLWYVGGALALGVVASWYLGAVAPDRLMRERPARERYAADLERLLDDIDRLGPLLRQLPLAEFHPFAGDSLAPGFFDVIAHAEDPAFWAPTDIAAHHDEITVPALNVGGWYDIFLGATIRNYVGMRQRGGQSQEQEARAGQRLLIGPWDHGPLTNVVGEHDFGIRSARLMIDLDGIMLRWFDYWLKGEANGVDAEPPVRLFVMGENRWRTESDWPPARARMTRYYLHSGGRANTLRGDGQLSTEPPGATVPPDHYLYDPHDPVPTRGGPLCCSRAILPGGAYDQRPIEERADVLVYSAPPLDTPVEVTGPITVHLWAQSSAPDTDFTAKLVDVGPCGYARNLVDGVIRARYRRGLDRPKLLEPGEVAEYTIDLWATSNVFQPGHRIRLEISSSNFPRIDRNPNTGHPLGTDREADLRPAMQTIYHDAARPSHVVLPIVPSGAEVTGTTDEHR
ncbi:MAG: CocE/NonD family hydrolase [Chloroflexi bacterium]|nr:CocE/NonD family hydrolase [Chloroflexota bacterium]